MIPTVPVWTEAFSRGPCREGHRQGPSTAVGKALPSCPVNAADDIAEFLATPPGEDHARAGRPAELRHAAGARPAPRGGRLAGRRQRRLLPAPGARPGQRRLRARARGARPGAPARRCRAHAPLRPRRAAGRRHRSPRSARGRRGRASARSSSACSTRSRRRRSSAPSTATTWPPTRSVARCTRRCSRAPSSRPTAGASRSWIRRRASSIPTGSGWPRSSSPRCARRPAATRTTAACQDLIGELSTRSDEFRVRWAAHNVRFHRTGTKRLQHPIVGELELSYETLTLDADDGLRLALYTAEAGLGLPAGARPAGQLDGDAGPA